MRKKIYAFWKQGGKHAILCAPPRSGKTYTFASIAKDFADHGRKTLLLTDREELLSQSNNSYVNFGLEAFFIQAGCRTVNNNFSCYISMAQTLRRRIEDKDQHFIDFIKSMDAIFIDECHEQIFNFLLESGIINDIWLAGFTGTPARRGKMRQLGLDYEEIFQTVTPSELLKNERIVNADIYEFRSPDTSNVGFDPKTGDYKAGELFNQFNNRQLYTGVVKNYTELVDNTKFMEYCITKEHAIKSAIEFYEAGYNVKFITSHTGKPKPLKSKSEGSLIRYEENVRKYELYKKWFPILSGDRKEIFDGFHRSKFLGLVNVDIATKGFDCPDMETVILNYKTMSLTRYLQSALRGATKCEGKYHYNLLDFGENVKEFGNPLDDHVYNLWHQEGKGGGLPPLKECGYDNQGKPINGGGCRRLIPASWNICMFDGCGFKYPDKKLKEIELRMVEAEKIMGASANSPKNMDFEQLTKYRELKGYKMPWLWRQLHLRGDLEKYAKKYHWSAGVLKKAKNYCDNIN